MKRLISVLVAGLLALPSWAQTADVDGEVTALDKVQGRITLKHGEIKNLDMPPMRMAFRVKDTKMLDGIAVGDRVKFAADKVGGQYVVTA
jgi:Cu(I)/Ag(I) efflux system periplasmic protein CusF